MAGNLSQEIKILIKTPNIRGAIKGLEDINVQLKKLEVSLSSISKVSKGSLGSIKGITTAVSKLNTETKKLSTSTQQANKSLATQNSLLSLGGRNIESAFASIAVWTIATTAVFGLIRGIKDLISTSIKLETQFTKLAVVAGKFNEGASAFTSRINDFQRVSKQTGTTIREVSDALEIFLRQGLSISKSFELAKTSLVLMNLSELTALSATEALTAAYQNFGIEAKDTITIVDGFIAVAKRNAVSVDDLANSLKRTASLFAEFARAGNVAIDELSGFTTAIKISTRQTGQAIGTSLRTIFTRLVRPETQKELEKIGIASRLTGDRIQDLTTILIQLSSRWKSLTDEQKRNISETIAGVRRVNEFIALMNNFRTSIKATIESVSSQNEALQANDLIMNTTEKSLKKLRGQWESLSVAIISNSQTFRNFIDSITNLLVVFEKFGKEIGIITASLGGLGLALVAPYFAAFIAEVGALTFLLSKLGSQLNETKNRINELQTTTETQISITNSQGVALKKIIELYTQLTASSINLKKAGKDTTDIDKERLTVLNELRKQIGLNTIKELNDIVVKQTLSKATDSYNKILSDRLKLERELERIKLDKQALELAHAINSLSKDIKSLPLSYIFAAQKEIDSFNNQAETTKKIFLKIASSIREGKLSISDFTKQWETLSKGLGKFSGQAKTIFLRLFKLKQGLDALKQQDIFADANQKKQIEDLVKFYKIKLKELTDISKTSFDKISTSQFKIFDIFNRIPKLSIKGLDLGIAKPIAGTLTSLFNLNKELDNLETKIKKITGLSAPELIGNETQLKATLKELEKADKDKASALLNQIKQYADLKTKQEELNQTLIFNKTTLDDILGKKKEELTITQALDEDNKRLIKRNTILLNSQKERKTILKNLQILKDKGVGITNETISKVTTILNTENKINEVKRDQIKLEIERQKTLDKISNIGKEFEFQLKANNLNSLTSFRAEQSKFNIIQNEINAYRELLQSQEGLKLSAEQRKKIEDDIRNLQIEQAQTLRGISTQYDSILEDGIFNIIKGTGTWKDLLNSIADDTLKKIIKSFLQTETLTNQLVKNLPNISDVLGVNIGGIFSGNGKEGEDNTEKLQKGIEKGGDKTSKSIEKGLTNGATITNKAIKDAFSAGVLSFAVTGKSNAALLSSALSGTLSAISSGVAKSATASGATGVAGALGAVSPFIPIIGTLIGGLFSRRKKYVPPPAREEFVQSTTPASQVAQFSGSQVNNYEVVIQVDVEALELTPSRTRDLALKISDEFQKIRSTTAG